MRGRRCARRSRSGGRKPQRLRGACAGASSAPARAVSGLRPGTLRSPARSWLTWILGSFAGADARPGMGRNRRPASRKLTHDPRRARPDAVNLLSHVSLGAHTGLQGNRRDGAPEGAPAPYGRSSPDRTFRRWARPRGGPLGAPVSCTSVFGRSISPHSFPGRSEQGAARAPLTKRAAERWLSDN